jgi:ring-1,2-phenylacetyl-CoA epoxidase subunit PaaE
VTTTAPAAARHELHTLRVAEVESLTDDAVALTFDVPKELEEVFRFTPGQHVALVRRDHGDAIRRNYSVCSAVGGCLRVAVKRLPEGVFSGYVHGELHAGDELDVLPPSGHFTVTLDPARSRNCAAIAAGSGITPVLSILSSVLAVEPQSTCTLIYGNRTTGSIMFTEELEDLKDRYPQRFQMIHVLSREPQPVALAEGRIDGPKLEQLLDTLVPPAGIDEWFVCGPFSMVETVRATLRGRGVPAASIHTELFHASDPAVVDRPEPEDPAALEGAPMVTLMLHGRRTELRVPREGRSILDAALAVRPDAPYACKGGVCGTCRCRLLEGEVRMDHAYALEEDEIGAGVRLACQSHPVSDTVMVDFDGV